MYSSLTMYLARYNYVNTKQSIHPYYTVLYSVIKTENKYQYMNKKKLRNERSFSVIFCALYLSIFRALYLVGRKAAAAKQQPKSVQNTLLKATSTMQYNTKYISSTIYIKCVCFCSRSVRNMQVNINASPSTNEEVRANLKPSRSLLKIHPLCSINLMQNTSKMSEDPSLSHVWQLERQSLKQDGEG